MATNKLKLKGELELDVTLKNLKALEKELRAAQDKISKTLDTNEINNKLSDKDKKKIKALSDQQTESLGQAKKDLAVAQNQLNARTKLMEKLAKDSKNFAQLSPSEQKRFRTEVSGVNTAIKAARKGFENFGRFTEELKPRQARTFNTAIKRGVAALDEQAAANAKVTKQINQFAKAENAQKSRIQAQRLKIAKQEQAARERALRPLLTKRASELSGDERKTVRGALAGRQNVLKQREGLAVSRGTSSEEYVARLTKARQEASAALRAYDKQIVDHQKKVAANAQLTKLETAELTKQNRISKIFADRESKAAAQKLRDDVSRAKGLEQLDKRNQKRAEERVASEKAVAQQAAKEYQQYIAQQEKADEAAYRARQRKRKDQIRENEKFQKVLRRDELAAYRENEKRKLSADQKVFDERNRVLKQQDSLALKRRIADKIAREHGAKNFDQLSFRNVNREDIRSLQDYAKARVAATNAHLQSLRKQGAEVSPDRINKVTAAQKKQEDAVVKLDKAYRNMNHPLKQINLLFRQFFRFAIGYGVLYQMLGAVKALVGGIVQLDEALKSIQAITGSSVQQMEQLETVIKSVATTTKFTTTEIAAATRLLGQAGVSADELPDALRATADFAAATNSELEVAADLITTTRNVFKSLGDQTLSDQLTKAINISKLNAADLKTILSISAQTAQSYNLTAEQYLGAVTTLRNAGIKASTVATGLRQGLLEIFSPTARTAKALKDRYRQLGENVTEEVVKQRFFGFTKADNPLLAVLAELKRLGFADEAQKEFQRAFNVRASNAIKALVNNYDELAEAEAKITFGVSAAEAAEIQMQSLSNSLKNLGAAFTVLGDAILGGGVGSLETFTDSLTDAITKLTELDTELKLQGKKGLGAGLLPGLIGAAAGGFGGRTVKGKLALGAAGFASGTAAGIGDEGGGVSDAGSAGLVSILGYLGLGGLVRQGFGEGLIKQVTKLPIIGRMIAGIAGFGLGPAVGAMLAIAGLFLSFSGLLTDAESPAEKAGLEAQGARGKLEQTRAKIAGLQGQRDEFDIGAARRGENQGKAASTLVGLQNDVSDFQVALDEIFGKIAEGKRDELLALLKRFANVSTKERGTLAGQLKGISELEGEGEPLDRKLFDLSTALQNSTGRANAVINAISEQVNKANQVLSLALQEGESIYDEEFDRQRGIIAAYKDNPEIRRIIQGISEKSREEQLKVIEAYYDSLSNIVENGTEPLSGLIKKESEQATVALQKNIAVLLATGANDALSVEVAITNVVDGVSSLRGSVIANTEAMVDELVRQRDELIRLSQVDPNSLTKEVILDTPYGISPPIYTEVPDKEAQTRATNAAALIPALDEGIVQAKANQEKIKQQRQKLLDSTITAAVADLEEFGEIIATERGAEIAESALQGADNAAAKEEVRKLLETPQRITDLIAEVQDGGISLDELDEIAFVKGLEAILAVLNIVSSSSNTARDAEKRASELASLLPSPDRVSRIDKLTRTIAERKGKNKVNIDTLTTQDVSNPIIERRNLQIQEDALEVARINDQIKRLGSGSEDEKIVERRNKLRISLKKAQAKLEGRTDEAQKAIQDAVEIIENIRIKTQARVHALELIAAKKEIGLSGAGVPDVDLFSSSIDKIDQVHDEMLEEFRIKLIRDGIKPGTELFQKEMEERSFLLRDLRTNSEEFTKQLKELTSGLRKQAALLASRPVTRGVQQDATSGRLGTEGRDRRRQQAENQLGANVNLRAAASVELNQQKAALEAQQAAGLTDDAAATAQTIEGLNQQIYKLDQASASLLITTKENSSNSQDRADAALGLILPVQQLNEALQDSEYAFVNLADSINQGFLDAVEGVGDALAYAIIEGENFVDAMLDIFYDIFKEQATTGIKTLVTTLAGSALSSLPAGATSLIPGLGGAAADAASGAVSGAVDKGVEAATTGTAVASAVTLALTPATLGLQTANTQLFLAGTTLNTAAAALTAAATALTTSATTSSLGGLVATGGTFGRAGITNSYKGGGIISGPGTGTSDSIIGVHLNGKKSSLIGVSNGESILTEEATNMFGDDFIHMANAGKLKGFSDGAVMGRGEVAAGARPAEAAAAVSPSVTNKNDTTIVNAIDSSSVVAAALETPAGSRAILNYLRANKSKVSRIIG